MSDSKGTVVIRYWHCADPPPAYVDGHESFLSSKCHYTASFYPPDRLIVSYINEPVKKTFDAAANRR